MCDGGECTRGAVARCYCSSVDASSGAVVRRRVGRWEALAPLLLVISAAIRVAATYFHPRCFIDLHVYVLGGAALDRPGTLYVFAYQTPDQLLPFTYPPFAA